MPKGTGGFLHPDNIIKEFNIKQGMKIADFGCGAGYFSMSLAKTVGEDGKVYAVDVLESALESIQSKAKLQGLFNIEAIRANLEEKRGSGLDHNSIDLVLLANILFQSSKKESIIEEAKRIVKPSGKIIIIEWEKEQLMGPPEKFIVSKDKVSQIAKNNNLKEKKEFKAGKNHWGMIFTG